MLIAIRGKGEMKEAFAYYSGPTRASPWTHGMATPNMNALYRMTKNRCCK
jgi:hypothetical protein